MPALICWFTFLWLGLAFKYFTWRSCNSNNCLKLQWIHGSSHELPQMALWCIQFTIFSALIQPVNVALLSRLIIAKLSDLIFLQDSSSHSRLPAGFKEEAEWMERSAFYPDLGMSAIRPMKTPHFKLLLFTIVIITIIANDCQVSKKKKTTPFLFKDDDDCGDFHSAAKTTEIWIVSSGKLFLSPFFSFFSLLAAACFRKCRYSEGSRELARR